MLFALLLACQDYKLEFTDQDDPTPFETHDSAPPEESDPPEDSDPADPPEDSEAPPEDSDPPEESDPPEDSEVSSPEAGCADGEREGFQSWDDYPDIAACSGAWSVGGLTRDDLAPTCGRAAGDDGASPDGEGCSAADICAEGWHVCEGAAEVDALSATGCDGAVPEGTPDKSLLFAVSQHSTSDTVCDDSSPSGNDVFGCGNLGTQLSADKNCGPLNRALASMNADSCGFNEAEPSLGPWECDGDGDSHLAEGTLVTKKGCPGDSCSYDGAPVGSSDKGGVLCCR